MHTSTRLFLLISSLVWLSACSNNSLTSDLPTCKRACVAPVRGAPIVKLPTSPSDPAQVWTLTNEHGPTSIGSSSKPDELLGFVDAQNRTQIAKGWPMPSSLYVACAERSPASRIADLIQHPNAKDFKALGLGGLHTTGSAGFAVVRVWDQDAAKRDTTAKTAALIQRQGDTITLHNTPITQPRDIPTCTPAQTCPILLFNLHQWTCGELIEWIDALASQQRVVGCTAHKP